MQIITEVKYVKAAERAKKRKSLFKGLLGLMSICCLVYAILNAPKEQAVMFFGAFILLALMSTI